MNIPVLKKQSIKIVTLGEIMLRFSTPYFMSIIKDIFPQLLLMPTAGVFPTQENIAGWFKAGVFTEEKGKQTHQ